MIALTTSGIVLVAWTLISSLNAKVEFEFGKDAEVISGLDGNFVVPKNDGIIKNFILGTGGYERPMITFMQKLLELHASPSRQKIFVDVGAHIGVWSVPFAKLFSKDGGEVFTFEAQRNLVNHLDATMILNGISNMHTIYAVVSNTTGQRDITDIMYSEDIVDHSKFSVHNNNGAESGEKKIRVTSFTLDSVYENELERKCPLFVKIDVEYHELEVLVGATNVLTVCKPLLLLDASCPSLNRSIFKLLWSFGYKLGWLIQTVSQFDISFEGVNTLDTIRHYEEYDEVTFNRWFFGPAHVLAIPPGMNSESIFSANSQSLRLIEEGKYGIGEYDIKYCIEGFSKDQQGLNVPRCGFIYSEDDVQYRGVEGFESPPCEKQATQFALKYHEYFD